MKNCLRCKKSYHTGRKFVYKVDVTKNKKKNTENRETIFISNEMLRATNYMNRQ